MWAKWSCFCGHRWYRQRGFIPNCSVSGMQSSRSVSWLCWCREQHEWLGKDVWKASRTCTALRFCQKTTYKERCPFGGTFGWALKGLGDWKGSRPCLFFSSYLWLLSRRLTRLRGFCALYWGQFLTKLPAADLRAQRCGEERGICGECGAGAVTGCA